MLDSPLISLTVPERSTDEPRFQVHPLQMFLPRAECVLAVWTHSVRTDSGTIQTSELADGSHVIALKATSTSADLLAREWRTNNNHVLGLSLLKRSSSTSHPDLSLALAFSAYLRGNRSTVPLVMLERMVIDGLMVIPHFVRKCGGDRGESDQVLWEGVSEAELGDIYSTDTASAAFWADHASDVLTLRRRIHQSEFPETETETELSRTLCGGRYLSFRFVLEHDALVQRAIRDLKGSRAESIDPMGGDRHG